MNKMIKASVAGAAGVSLLMGGFGTYALWHDSATADNSSVTSGELNITAGTATWQDISTAGPNSWTVGSAIVPGDKLKMTQTFDVKATGANMKGKLTFDPGAVNATAFGTNLTITPTATVDGAFTPVSGTPNAWTFSAPLSGTKTVTATVVYDFASSTTGVQAQKAAASIGTSTFTLDQVRP